MSIEETTERVDAMLPGQGENHLATRLAQGPAVPSPSEEYEDQYQRIGRWKGPCGTREAQAGVTEFWLGQGEPGLRWLAGRLRQEGHIDALDGTAALLWKAGEGAIRPIIEELEREPPIDQADALLRALRSIAEDGVEAPPSLATRLEAALSVFVHHSDADVREYAARATRLLPRERAAGLLRCRLDAETDPDVRQAVEDLINVGATGRG